MRFLCIVLVSGAVKTVTGAAWSGDRKCGLVWWRGLATESVVWSGGVVWRQKVWSGMVAWSGDRKCGLVWWRGMATGNRDSSIAIDIFLRKN